VYRDLPTALTLSVFVSLFSKFVSVPTCLCVYVSNMCCCVCMTCSRLIKNVTVLSIHGKKDNRNKVFTRFRTLSRFVCFGTVLHVQSCAKLCFIVCLKKRVVKWSVMSNIFTTSMLQRSWIENYFLWNQTHIFLRIKRFLLNFFLCCLNI